eukprot:9932496-Alexandrium_andersonii.AAC.1
MAPGKLRSDRHSGKDSTQTLRLRCATVSDRTGPTLSSTTGPHAGGTGALEPTPSADQVGKSTPSAAWTSSSAPGWTSQPFSGPIGGRFPTSRHRQSA